MSRWSLPDPSTRVDVVPAIGSSSTVQRVQSLAGWLLITGGGMAVLGSVLPWSVVTSYKKVLSADGLGGDGRITLLLGLVLVGLGTVALLRRVPQGLAAGSLVAAIAVTVVAGYNAFDLGSLGDASDQLSSLELGHGLVITLIGGLIGVVGGARLVARA